MSNVIYYSKTALTGGAANALDYIDGSLLNDGDFAFVTVYGVLYVYRLSSSSGASESSPAIIAPDTNAGTKRWLMQKLNESRMGYIYGLNLSHGADTDHDISVASGIARDGADADDMILTSALTKQADSVWSVGSAAGGMASGESLPTSGTIHVWLIKRSDTGVVDVMFNNNAATGLSPALPPGYGYKRRIGSYRTDASANILNGDYCGNGNNRRFIYDAPVWDINVNNPGTSAVLASLSVPAGIKVNAIIRGRVVDGGLNNYPLIYTSSPDSIDLAPSTSVAPYVDHNSNNNTNSSPFMKMILTNTSNQIRYRLNTSGAGNLVYIITDGWEDYL